MQSGLVKLLKHGVLDSYPVLNVFRESFFPRNINTLYGRGVEIISPIMEREKVNVLAFIEFENLVNIFNRSLSNATKQRSILSLDAKN